jgi:AraC-like DNA-binding protein
MSRLSRYSRLITDDPDELCQHLSRLLDRQMTELVDRQRFQLSGHTAKLELFTVGESEISGALSSRAIISGYSLLRVEVGGMERHFHGYQRTHRLSPGDGSLTTPGQEISTKLQTSGGISTTVTFTIPDALVKRAAEFMIGEPAREPLVIAEPVDLSPPTYLGEKINFLLDELDRDGGLFDKYPRIAQQLQCSLVCELIEQTPNNYQALVAHHFGGPARRHVAKAEEYIEANVSNPITVGSMAAAAGISARTLRDACHRVRDMTPEMILRAMRMRSARRRLENPLPDDTVASIAHEFGFGNVSRFGHHYRREFNGETPREALLRGRRRLRVFTARTSQ